jgi:hypothetical protein
VAFFGGPEILFLLHPPVNENGHSLGEIKWSFGREKKTYKIIYPCGVDECHIFYFS